jgi:hypothetical protein
MDNATRKLFQQIALLGPAIFLQRLVPKERLESEYLRFNRRNARNFLLLKLLTEVQKTGFVFSRWNDSLKSNAVSKPKSVREQILETLIDEQSLWQRKLMEGLVFLINFSSTNELPFYYHLLLIQELDRYYNMLLEQKDFFSRGSELTRKTITLLTKRIQSVEDEIGDLSKCRYLSEAKPLSKRRHRPVTSSLRQQMKRALSIAAPGEKTALGYTYGQSYAETSGNIHFNATRFDLTDLIGRFSFGFAQCGRLAFAIIQRAHDLTELEPEGINKLLIKQDRNRPSNTAPTLKKLQKGDFVLANGPYLGEVIDVETSDFGYEIYLVKYLQETPVEGVEEDWFPSFEIHFFMKRCEMVREVLSELQKDVQECGVPVLQVSEEEVREATHHAVVKLWQAGFDRYIRRTMLPKRRGDPGMGYNLIKEGG